MSEKFTSQSYEEELDEQEEIAQEQIQEGIIEEDPKKIEEAILTFNIIDGVREGLEEIGFAESDLAVIDPEGLDKPGRVTAGLFDRDDNQIGMASVHDMKNVINTSAQDIKKETSDKVKAIMAHEERHQDSWENASKRGEEGKIGEYFGAEADVALQEMMASQGTENLDAYDEERRRADAIVHSIGLHRSDVIRLIHEGREAEVVQAGVEEESEYVEVEEEKRKAA